MSSAFQCVTAAYLCYQLELNATIEAEVTESNKSVIEQELGSV